MVMKPPPPKLPALGSVVAREKPTATAASTAFLPYLIFLYRYQMKEHFDLQPFRLYLRLDEMDEDNLCNLGLNIDKEKLK